METIKLEDIQVDRCTACEGLWFDLREHEHLKGMPGSERVDTGDPARGHQQDAIREVKCPKCHTPLIRMVFPDQPHIRYEMCSTCHGIYLDAGEFVDFKRKTLAERVRHALAPLMQR
jgi:Zn-finger nucleic acid-binding protein